MRTKNETLESNNEKSAKKLHDESEMRESAEKADERRKRNQGTRATKENSGTHTQRRRRINEAELADLHSISSFSVLTVG